jgi:acyl-coenzyme A thioesterase PaaI-like protein
MSAIGNMARLGRAGTVIAISGARGGFVPMTTVQQSTTFQRPVAGVDLIVRVRVTKLGRTLAFADVTMTADGADAPVAHASTVYAILA